MFFLLICIIRKFKQRSFRQQKNFIININLSLPEKPSIAVLPFDNMSGDSEQKYFADGVTESITAALSRIRSFFVIARN